METELKSADISTTTTENNSMSFVPFSSTRIHLSDIDNTAKNDDKLDEYAIIRNQKTHLKSIGYCINEGSFKFTQQESAFLKEYFMKNDDIISKKEFTKYMQDLDKENYVCISF